jgi:hypothetical protein
MEQYISLRQLHPIACQVKEKWSEDNAVLAIMVVGPSNADYNAQSGDSVLPTFIYDEHDRPFVYGGTVAIDVYALADKQYNRVIDYVHYPGDRVLVITGRDILPLGYVDYHCFGTALVRDAFVLDVINLPVQPSTTQEV